MRSKKYIGGEIELQRLPLGFQHKNPIQDMKGTWTVSGRAAFCAILRMIKKQGIRKILLPAYLCESVIQPVIECELDYAYYPVSETLTAMPQPEKNSAVVLLHYFGWLNPATEQLRREAGESFVLIEDMTQSVFSSWKLHHGHKSLVFLSFRKVGPVPLGGWFNINASLIPMTPVYEMLFWKSIAARLYKNLYLNSEGESDLKTEKTYLDMFQDIENIFDLSAEPYALGEDSMKFIQGINWRNAAEIRKENWSYLHKNLKGSVVPFNQELSKGVVPLGYVIKSKDRDNFRARLMASGIFCPINWPLPKDINIEKFPISHSLSNSLLTIPIDQRYNEEDMDLITQSILGN